MSQARDIGTAAGRGGGQSSKTASAIAIGWNILLRTHLCAVITGEPVGEMTDHLERTPDPEPHHYTGLQHDGFDARPDEDFAHRGAGREVC